MKIVATIAVLMMALAPAHAQTTKQITNLTGKWTGTFTRTAPDGRTQSLDFTMDLIQKGEVLTGTIGPSADRQWPIEKGGTVNAGKITFKVQQPDGPMRTFTLKPVKDRLEGEMLAELNGQSFTAKVDAGRTPKEK